MSDHLELDDIQGIVARGYGSLKSAGFLLLSIEEPGAARRCLSTIAESLTPSDRRPERLALNVAFTASGLSALGVPREVRTGFSFEFRDGMTSAHRSRVLGDLEENAPSTWAWGGPSTPPVDLLIMVYARDEPEFDRALAELIRGFTGVAVVTTLETVALTDREHFGFHDGISQPAIEGLDQATIPANTVKAGEFVLGYRNEYGFYTDSPSLERSADPTGILPVNPGGRGRADLGKNGSYLVLRQLAQDVPGFWDFVDRSAQALGGDGDPEARVALAAKMMGRWPSGAPLVASPDRDDPLLSDENDFGYHHLDPHGYRCPVGSHVRRAHPRDSLDPEPGSDKSIDIGKRHRILRRGRQYGSWVSPLAPGEVAESDSVERGLYFMCLNGNLARQFEFVQHTWINNPKFDGLYDDADPVVAARSASGRTLTIPTPPVRRRVTGVPSFVNVRGGAYFFLPGIRAVRYLASLE
ncbi:MAG: Dyp-type peroxidase [Actinomycetota bacterium]